MAPSCRSLEMTMTRSAGFFKLLLLVLLFAFGSLSLSTLITRRASFYKSYREELFYENDNIPTSVQINDVQFQPIGGEFYVYAAYLEEGNLVKIVGMTRTDPGDDTNKEVVMCAITDHTGQNGGLPRREASIHRVTRKRSFTLFTPIVITCDFGHVTEGRVKYVKLIRNDSSVILKVEQSFRPSLRVTADQSAHLPFSQPRYLLAKCVPMLYGATDLHSVQSMLATNSKYGVDHFQFYAHSNAFSTLLGKLEGAFGSRKYNITIKSWRLPIRPFEISYYGQLVMLQDCLYSLRTKAERILVADMDEYLRPLQSDPQFLSRDYASHTASSWIFATVRTCDDLKNEISDESPNWSLTKYLVVPKKIRSLGVHKVAHYEDENAMAVNVSTAQAVIVHCRRH